jgi:DNA-binding SARP family transcriptional activator
MLRVRLLGELAVEADSREVVLTGSWRARSLLAWLALNPGAHLRSELAARFWPDVPDTSARDELNRQLSGVLERLASAAEDACDIEGALDWTRRRVALDPLVEDAHRDLIRLLTERGDRAEALEAYAKLRARLRRELGISPSTVHHNRATTRRAGGIAASSRRCGSQRSAEGHRVRARPGRTPWVVPQSHPPADDKCLGAEHNDPVAAMRNPTDQRRSP